MRACEKQWLGIKSYIGATVAGNHTSLQLDIIIHSSFKLKKPYSETATT